jgi:mannose-6-phosphate isomerase
VIPLSNPIRPYAWGSRTVLAALQRRPVPSPGPEAEMWLGAHPTAPSLVPGPDGPVPLTDAITADPQTTLGEGVLTRFGNRLPYLMKVLAADTPVSLQAHPDAAQARRGFSREQETGATVRNYVDPFHKPELLVALQDFDALCGFRDPDESARDLAGLDVPALTPVVEALRTGDVAQRLRTAVEMLLGWPQPERPALAAEVARSGHPLVARLAAQYPADLGVVVALLLNHVRLSQGEAVFMPAGNLHSYLHGAGVEIMAASDNVLRGGLTPKHVDQGELVRVLRYEVLGEPVRKPIVLGAGIVGWQPPAVAEFNLLQATVTPAGPVSLPGYGPRIVLCVRGSVEISTGVGSVRRLTSGDAVFVAASEPAVAASGDGVLFQGAPNLAGAPSL